MGTRAGLPGRPYGPRRHARLTTSSQESTMPKFMLIVGGADLDKRSGNPEFQPQMLQHYLAWIDGLRAGGHFLSSEKLQDRTGRRLAVCGGEVVDRPFVESKHLHRGGCHA